MTLWRFFRVLVHSLAICIATLCVLALYAAATTHGAKVSLIACTTDACVRGSRIQPSQPQIASVREMQYKRRIVRLLKRVKHFESQPVPFAMTEDEARKQIIRKLEREGDMQGIEPYFLGTQLCDAGMSDLERESFKAILKRHSSNTLSLQLQQHQEEEPIHQDLQATVGRDRYLEIVKTCGKMVTDYSKQAEDFQRSSQIAMLNLSPEQLARMQALKGEYGDILGVYGRGSNTESNPHSAYLDETGHLPSPQPTPLLEQANSSVAELVLDISESEPRLAELAAKFDSLLTPEQRALIKKYSAEGATVEHWSMDEIPIPREVLGFWQQESLK